MQKTVPSSVNVSGHGDFFLQRPCRDSFFLFFTACASVRGEKERERDLFSLSLSGNVIDRLGRRVWQL